MVLESIGVVQITGQQVVKRGDIGRTLDRGVAAEGEDAAPGLGRYCPGATAESWPRELSERRGVMGPADRHAGSAEELTTVGLGELIAHDPLEIQDQPNSIAPGIAALHTGLYRGSCPFATLHAERAKVSPVSPGAPPNSLKLK